jgi:hypothetical protein
MKRIAIYTAIFSDRDAYREPPNGDFDTFLFTDRPVPTEHAQVRLVPPIFKDPVRNARLVKLLPHVFLPDHEITVWMDGSVEMRHPGVDALVDRHLLESGLATFRHADRDCLYQEAASCIEQRKDDPAVIAAQVTSYRQAGYPDNAGLVETAVLLRRSLEPEVVAFDEAWWAELRDHSRRDQLSFNYVAWKRSFRYATMPGTVYDNDDFLIYFHALKDTPHGR